MVPAFAAKTIIVNSPGVALPSQQLFCLDENGWCEKVDVLVVTRFKATIFSTAAATPKGKVSERLYMF